MVAALAKAQQIPVIVAAESYKFSEKVQLDSIVYNELGQTTEIAVMAPDSEGTGALVPVAQKQTGYRGSASPLTSSGAADGAQASAAAECDPVVLPAAWRTSSAGDASAAQLPFHVVNLRYDLTPIGNISVVATETGLTPPTSVPVLMREMVQSDMLHLAGRPGVPSAARAATSGAGSNTLAPISLSGASSAGSAPAAPALLV
jgi:translation initiation factor eIF-2B subunit delta